MKNRDIFLKDPLGFELLNNGVTKVAEVGTDPEQLKTLRFELETFVCDGEYAKGMERILSAYLNGLSKPEQNAAWVSGFFGSGKSHLVKMLRYLWVDFPFPDQATARSLAHLPDGIRDMFKELSTRGRQHGGLRAAAGTLGAGNMDNVRLAFLQLVFRANGIPESLGAARFLLWLRDRKLLDKVRAELVAKGKDPEKEFRNLYVSTPLGEALVAADSTFGSAKNAQEALRTQFPNSTSPTLQETLAILKQVFGNGDKLPCTLIVVDEIQQFIGDKIPRAMDVQEIAEHCCRDLDSRLLFVGTGQSALNATPNLQRLQARFSVKVPLSDTDVENVIRKTVLAKKPEQLGAITAALESNSGEISRHLQGTKVAATRADEPFYAPDYPLLPVRRRFWERVLRNVDATGTVAQLRTQLKITFDAVREWADRPLGHVVPADFIYDQIATDLLQTGMLQREYHEIIVGQRDNTPAGLLRSRLCALMFLIQQLPRSGAADDGVRATPDMLVDLLVEDLKTDGARLRQEVPQLLAQLVKQGKVMQVGDEFCLQTREGAAWTHDFNGRRSRVLNDESRLATAREEKLREAVNQSLNRTDLQQGTSRQTRRFSVEFSSALPRQATDELVVWVRHGWQEPEKTVLDDARNAGSSSPMLFAWLPREQHEELRQALASALAAQETLDAHGIPQSAEGTQARNAIQTQLETARLQAANAVKRVLQGAKVFLGGGSEANGLELPDKVADAAASALNRLFPSFAEADHANWSQVLNRARAGDVGALQHVGYQGETVRHPVCKRIYDLIGAGKKGKEVREHFKSAPFGWPQDAIDASLVIIALAGNLRAQVNGQPVLARDLNQTQISNAAFYQDVPPLQVTQRLDLKALFQRLGVAAPKDTDLSPAAGQFLRQLLELAASAGGAAPAPEPPAVQFIKELQTYSGNAQLLEIHQARERLAQDIVAWKQRADQLARRLPRWQRLQHLIQLAHGLPEATAAALSINALIAQRGLLADPDPVPPLVQALTAALRNATVQVQTGLEATHRQQLDHLTASAVWTKLDDAQRTTLAAEHQLAPPPPIAVGTEDEIVATLQANSLSNRRTLVEALPQRFSHALEAAARLLQPKAVRVPLRNATVHDEAELDAWLTDVRTRAAEQLKDGPVIL